MPLLNESFNFQSKSLADSSGMFSPPSIIKDTLMGDESSSLRSILSLDSTPGVNSSIEDQTAIILASSNTNKVQHKELSCLPSHPEPTPHTPVYPNLLDKTSNIFYTNNNFSFEDNLKHESYHLDNTDSGINSFFVINGDTNNSNQYTSKQNDCSTEAKDEIKSEMFVDHAYYQENSPPAQSFSRLNAERFKAISTGAYDDFKEVKREKQCLKNITNLKFNNSSVLAPRQTLASAVANHIYKVTNQKPSTSAIDNILSQKMMQSKIASNAAQDTENLNSNWIESNIRQTNNKRTQEHNENQNDNGFWGRYNSL